MRIPTSAAPDVQTAFREIHQLLQRFGLSHALNTRLKGQRITDAGDAVAGGDYVTLQQVQALMTGTVETAKAVATSAATATGGGTTPPLNDGIPDHGDIVNAQFALTPLTPASTDAEMMAFTRAVAWKLAALNENPLAGLLIKDAGANIFTCAGVSYSYTRVCYANGHVFKIIGAGDPGDPHFPEWLDDGPVDQSRYHVATDPGDPC